VESDRVEPRTFYGYADGRFHRSTDGGATFTAGATVPARNFHAVPGHAGDVWLAGETGLHRSTDGGDTFTALPGVTDAMNVAFGKAAPGASYPAVFLVGTVDGVDGVFRSDDVGGAWVRINDDAHRYGNSGDALAGDPRVHGRVYLGTNGRGILYADPTAPHTGSSAPPPGEQRTEPTPDRGGQG
jgi:hypothetical protein